MLQALIELSTRGAKPGGVEWFEVQLQKLRHDSTDEGGPAKLSMERADTDISVIRYLPVAFAGARRRLGADEVALDLPGRWHRDQVARLALLMTALPSLSNDAGGVVVRDLYLRGELEERRAVLKALPYLHRPESHIALAVESCRTNAQDMFEAIACENPYPAQYFPTLPFHQMVLKSLFMDLPAERIMGLQARITPDLCRMLDDFDAELTAAGRPLPQGMQWIRDRRPSGDDDQPVG